MVENNKKSYFHDALVTFGRISVWIVAPIVGALFLGRWLDVRQGTGQKWFLICAGIALILSVAGIAIETKKYLKRVEKEDAIKKDGN